MALSEGLGEERDTMAGEADTTTRENGLSVRELGF